MLYYDLLEICHISEDIRLSLDQYIEFVQFLPPIGIT